LKFYENEKARLDKKIQYLIDQNNKLEEKIFARDRNKNLQLTRLSINIPKEDKQKHYIISSQVVNECILRKDRVDYIISSQVINESILTANKKINQGISSQVVNIFIPSKSINNVDFINQKPSLLITNTPLGSNLANIGLRNNNNDSFNSLFSTCISASSDRKLNPFLNSGLKLSTSIINQDKVKENAPSEEVPLKIMQELQTVLNLMDLRYFNNRTILKQLSSKHLLQLHEEIKRYATSPDSIPTKMNGTMDMRYNISKSLVSAFSGYERFAKNY